MGSNESSLKKNNSNNTGLSDPQLDEILRMQKEMYDRINSSSTRPASLDVKVEVRKVYSQEDVDKILEQQINQTLQNALTAKVSTPELSTSGVAASSQKDVDKILEQEKKQTLQNALTAKVSTPEPSTGGVAASRSAVPTARDRIQEQTLVQNAHSSQFTTQSLHVVTTPASLISESRGSQYHQNKAEPMTASHASQYYQNKAGPMTASLGSQYIHQNNAGTVPTLLALPPQYRMGPVQTAPSRRTEGAPSAPPMPAIKSRSTSRPRPAKTTRNDQVCRSCGQEFGLTIFLCENGHSVCLHCKNQLSRCGTCQGPVTNMRNFSVEAYLAEMTVKCPNAKEGCTLTLKKMEMKEHLLECPFKDLACPLTAIFGHCMWTGKLSQLSSHFDSSHQEHRQGDVGKEMVLLDYQHNHRLLHCLALGPFNFLAQLKVCQPSRTLYMAVQMCGTKHSAAKWTYEFHVYNKQKPRKKYLFNDVCLSNSTDINEVFDDCNCAAVPLKHIADFDNKGIVNYKFYIKRVEDPKPRRNEKDTRSNDRANPRGDEDDRPRRNRRYGRGPNSGKAFVNKNNN